MTLSTKAQKIFKEIIKEGAMLGDLRRIAREIKKDHHLATELWSTGKLFPRLLSILIMDKKELCNNVVDMLFKDIEKHPMDDRLQLADWLMANQLANDRKLTGLMLSWQNDPSSLRRRIFWYYQGRLRWVGQSPPDNTAELLKAIEEGLLKEEPEVQWAMNFTAAWIGVFDKAYRKKCIEMGNNLGLYKDEVVAKGCSPQFLPKLIAQEVEKRKL
jgi:3-methyladenine DNA glycosylase AlkD